MKSRTQRQRTAVGQAVKAGKPFSMAFTTKPLPAGAGRISDVVLQVLKYDIFRDSAIGG